MPQSKRRRGPKRSNAKFNGASPANGNQEHHGNQSATGPGPNGPGFNAAFATGQLTDKRNNGNTASSRPITPAGSATTTTTITTSNTTTITASGQGAAPQQLPSYPDNVPASAVAAPATNQRDTRSSNPRPLPDSRNTNGSRRGGGPKSAAPGKELKGALPQATNAQKDPVISVPIVTGDNSVPSRRSGTHGATAATGHAKPGEQENIPPNIQMDQLRTTFQDLDLDAPPAEAPTQAPDRNPVTNGAGRGAPEAPAPVIVPFPGANNKQAGSKGQGPPAPPGPTLPGLIEPKTEEERKEREYHLKFMREALRMGDLALQTNETPVGCVLVYHGRIIAKGMNATNVTRNGTRHAELMALSALLSRQAGDLGDVNNNPALDDASWGDVDPQDGHIFPYGQKLHPAPIVSHSIITECILYVTVEPCVMCASLLRQLGIRKVYFGAVNDKFGGTGGVFRIHMNSKPVPRSTDRPYQNGYGPQDVSRIVKGRAAPVPRSEDDGDGGNVEDGYPVEGGYLRDEAVSLLRRFYVQENGRAPQPRKKEGRAARLFAMEAAAAKGGSTSELSEPDTPVDGVDAPNAEQAPLLSDDNTAKLVPTPLALTPAL